MYHSDDDDRPREGEIIPPGRGHPRPPDEATPPLWTMRQQRIFILPPGPWSMLIGLLALGALAVVGTVVFLGLFLLWLPVIGIVAAGALLAALLRGPSRF